MDLFDRSVGKKHSDLTEIQKFNEIDALKINAIQLVRAVSTDFTKIGGRPNLGSEFQWPTYGNISLAFICQLELSEINDKTVGLPNCGQLYFFYVQDQSTWGNEPKDLGSWRVVYRESEELLPETPCPEDLEMASMYKPVFVKGKPLITYPNREEKKVEPLCLDDEEEKRLWDLRENQYGKYPHHQIGGWPDPIQSPEMYKECQLCSNGISPEDAFARPSDSGILALLESSEEWVLLLQIDTDYETGMIWRDAGMLYFWIKKSDVQARKFDNVWMILQCG